MLTRAVPAARRAATSSYYAALPRQTERLHRLVESLLDFGRMEAGTSPYRLERLDAATLVRDVVARVSAAESAARDHVDIDDRAASDAVRRRRSRGADQRAVESARQRGEVLAGLPDDVRVEVEREPARVAIRVRDEGFGIPTRRAAARSSASSCAASRAKAERHQGHRHRPRHGPAHRRGARRATSRSTSEPGDGSTFTISCCREPRSASSRGARMARILIVEDEPDIALGAERRPDESKGYEVEVVGDGDDRGCARPRARMGPHPARRHAAEEGRLRRVPRAAARRRARHRSSC